MPPSNVKPPVCRRRRRAELAAAALLASGATGAAEVAGYVALTSDYVFRGVSYGEPAAQIALDVAGERGWYAGGWASTVDIDSGPGRRRDRQVNYYAGYTHAVSAVWSVGGNVVAYTFPGTDGPVDYDHVEYTFSLNYRDNVWLEYAYSPDLYHTGDPSRHAELYGEWPLGGYGVGIGIGHYDVSALTGQDYLHWQAGLSRRLGRATIDLRYHDTSRWVPVVSSPRRAGARIAVSVIIDF
ncbi:MAG: TorF family putative porin [Pseudomonadota bacterium]